MIATLARAGRVVVAIDTLGELAQPPVFGSQWTAVAQRLWRLDRENMIGAAPRGRRAGDRLGRPGSLDQVLRDMTRLAAAPRIGAR